MNRANLVENLIYLFLTSVQVCLLYPTLHAAPQIEPPKLPFPSENREETTAPYSVSESSLAPLDSMSISEPDDEQAPTSKTTAFTFLKPHRLSLSAGFFTGPYQDLKSNSVYLLGMDYQHPPIGSIRNHVGFSVGSGSHPFLYARREIYIRNIWKYLKSWSYSVQLELDTHQGAGALLSFNHFMGGAGISLTLHDQLDLLFLFYPVSSRGLGGEIKISSLIF